MLRHALTLSVATLLAVVAPAQEPTLVLSEHGVVTELAVAVDGQNLVPVASTMHGVIDAKLIRVPGRAALAVTWKEVDRGTPAGQWYALSLDGRTFLAPKSTQYELQLRYAAFDPLADEPAIPDAFRGQDQHLWIVQYATQGIEAYRDVLRQLGVEIHLFLAWHSNVVEMDARTAALVATLPFVRWVGAYHPAYKLDGRLMSELLANTRDSEPRRLNLLTTRRGPVGQEPIVAAVAALGGAVEATGGSGSPHTTGGSPPRDRPRPARDGSGEGASVLPESPEECDGANRGRSGGGGNGEGRAGDDMGLDIGIRVCGKKLNLIGLNKNHLFI